MLFHVKVYKTSRLQSQGRSAYKPYCLQIQYVDHIFCSSLHRLQMIKTVYGPWQSTNHALCRLSLFADQQLPKHTVCRLYKCRTYSPQNFQSAHHTDYRPYSLQTIKMKVFRPRQSHFHIIIDRQKWSVRQPIANRAGNLVSEFPTFSCSAVMNTKTGHIQHIVGQPLLKSLKKEEKWTHRQTDRTYLSSLLARDCKI